MVLLPVRHNPSVSLQVLVEALHGAPAVVDPLDVELLRKFCSECTAPTDEASVLSRPSEGAGTALGTGVGTAAAVAAKPKLVAGAWRS